MNAAEKAVVEDAAIRVRCNGLRQKLEEGQRVLETTLLSEQAAAEIESERHNSIASQLNMLFKKFGREKMLRAMLHQFFRLSPSSVLCPYTDCPTFQPFVSPGRARGHVGQQGRGY